MNNPALQRALECLADQLRRAVAKTQSANGYWFDVDADGKPVKCECGEHQKHRMANDIDYWYPSDPR
jgi:hypothetical protein